MTDRVGLCRVLLRTLVCAAAVLAVGTAPLPAAADEAGVGPDVADARARWATLAAELDAAVAARAAAAAALAETEASEAAAAAELDTETALLVDRERALTAAEQDHAEAVAAAVEARGDLRRSVAAHERAQVAVQDRRAELGRAAASAYAYGDPQARAVSSAIHALDASRTVGDFLNATERLAYVTVDARVDTDAALALLDARSGQTAAAFRHLVERRAAEGVAEVALADAEQAAAAQRTRRDEALDRHEHALAQLAERQREHEDAVAAVAHTEAARAEALEAVKGLGWLAGVPGPAGLTWPTDGRPGSGFGPRLHPIHGTVRPHLGVDVAAPTGQAVVAAAAGRVVAAGPRGGYGIAVVIDHGDGLTTLYAHLSALAVRAGQRVAEADRIGDVGSTGQSTGPHLHFEVRVGGKPQDPMRFFR